MTILARIVIGDLKIKWGYWKIEERTRIARIENGVNDRKRNSKPWDCKELVWIWSRITELNLKFYKIVAKRSIRLIKII